MFRTHLGPLSCHLPSKCPEVVGKEALGKAGEVFLEDPWSLSVYLPLPQTAWDPRAACHPPCFEDKQNYLTQSGRWGGRGPERFLPYHGVVLVFRKGPKPQRQRLPIEDPQCDDLSVLATLGDTWVDTEPVSWTVEGRR